jgi:hypothetical protein
MVAKPAAGIQGQINDKPYPLLARLGESYSRSGFIQNPFAKI